MSNRIRATYNHGVFVPLPGQALPDLPEDAEVEIVFHELEADTIVAVDAEGRAALLREIAESLKANSFTGNPPRITREELHERC